VKQFAELNPHITGVVDKILPITKIVNNENYFYDIKKLKVI
jgi:hypothetical protein